MLTIDTNRPDDEVAAAWMAWTARSNPGGPSKEDFHDDVRREGGADWGEQALLEILCEEPIRALEIVFLIARSTDDDWLLCNLGAGPIESLLAHDGTLLDAIAVEVATSPSLKIALASVWQNAMSEATWRAVQRLVAN